MKKPPAPFPPHRAIADNPEAVAAWHEAIESVAVDSYPRGFDILDPKCKGQSIDAFKKILAAATGDLRLSLTKLRDPESEDPYGKPITDPVTAAFKLIATKSFFRSKQIQTAVVAMRAAVAEGKPKASIVRTGMDTVKATDIHTEDLPPIFQAAAQAMIDTRKTIENAQRIAKRQADAIHATGKQADVARRALQAKIEATGTKDADGKLIGAEVPDVASEIIGIYPEGEWQAITAAATNGVLVFEPTLYPYDLYDGLLHVGYKAHFNELTCTYRISHPLVDNGTDDEWEDIIPSKDGFHPLTRARNAIISAGAWIDREPRCKEGDQDPVVALQRLKPNSWGTSDGLFQAFASLRGDKISIKNELVDFADEAIAHLKACTKEQRAAYVEQLRFVFTMIPGIKPGLGSQRLAEHAGIYLFTMLGHRILQNHPDYRPNGKFARQYRPCRETPVICGLPGIGKSTILESIIGADNPGFALGKMELSSNMEAMARAVVGNLLVAINDMGGAKFTPAEIRAIKSFLTEATIRLNPKHQKELVIPMPCAFIGTANDLNLPSDDGLEVRFVPFEMVRTNDATAEDWAGGSTPTEKFFAKYRLGFLYGGIQNAIINGNIEITNDLLSQKRAILRKVQRTKDDFSPAVEDAIMGGEYMDAEGKPFISGEIIAWQAGALEYPLDLGSEQLTFHRRRGDVILPEEPIEYQAIGPDPAKVSELRFPVLTLAFRKAVKNNTRLIDSIRETFDRFGWTDRDADGNQIYRKIKGNKHKVRGWAPR